MDERRKDGNGTERIFQISVHPITLSAALVSVYLLLLWQSISGLEVRKGKPPSICWGENEEEKDFFRVHIASLMWWGE